jgi:uncharacterized protein (TIGR00661 family)
LRGYNPNKLIALLKGRRRKFVIYGQGEKPPEGNLEFKNTSEDDFLANLAACRYVVANGGLSLISEALYLGKPILCLPIQFLYEQFFNAYFLARNELGDYFFENGNPENPLNAFENLLDRYQANISRNNFLGNKQLAARIEELMEKQDAGRCPPHSPG